MITVTMAMDTVTMDTVTMGTVTMDMVTMITTIYSQSAYMMLTVVVAHHVSCKEYFCMFWLIP